MKFEDKEESTITDLSYGKTERVVFEQILWLQINRINQVMTQKTSDTISFNVQFNMAVRSLDLLCQPLKDEKYKKAVISRLTSYKKEIDQTDEEQKRQAIKYSMNERRYGLLLELLQRKGHLFSTKGEGSI